MLIEIIWMRGSNNSDEGHAWVVDGCYDVEAKKKLMCTYDSVNWGVEKEWSGYYTCHNHINWGWDGKQNGYFDGGILDIYDSLTEDDGIRYQNYSGQDTDFYKNVQYFEVWR